MNEESEKSGKNLDDVDDVQTTASNDVPIWSDIATALMFLTRIPMPYYNKPLSQAAWAFPIVGWVVGACGAIVYIASTWVGLTGWLAATLAIGATIFITGALHEDGFGDVADGYWGGYTVEKRLEIMRDSRLGAYGGLALILNIAIRAGALASFYNPLLILVVMIAAHGLGRAMMACVMAGLNPAGKSGLAASAGKVTTTKALLAFLLAVVPFVAFAPIQAGLLILLVPILIAFFFIKIMKAKLGGYNGDSLGALGQVVEISVYLTVVAVGNSLGFSLLIS